MTAPGDPSALADIRAPYVGPGQRRLLALEVADRFAGDDPDACRELLEMLGLVDANGVKSW